MVDDVGNVRTARALPEAIKADVAEVARGNNQFALDLYAELAQGDGNVFLSPFSISTALAMVDAGAAGTTDAELRAALHFTLPGARTHAAYGALLASLQVGRDHGGYDLAVANRLFGQAGFPFLDGFLATTRKDYGAELATVDFAGNADAARIQVNQWVADHTDAKIRELFEPGSLDTSTILALVNAIVFKGTWANKFDRGSTADAAFRLADGSTVQTAMMHRTGPMAMAAFGATSVLGMFPFNGGDLSFVVVMPDDPSGLPAVEAELAGGGLAAKLDAADPALRQQPDIQIALPKLAITGKYELPAALQALGITSAFDPDTADFSMMDGRGDLMLDDVVHEAMITVDEDGAEARAATGVGVGPTSAPSNPSFIVDRPFVFAIYDHVSHSILFLGRVTDPRT
jgi:serpin B